jgi:hypothetical protein
MAADPDRTIHRAYRLPEVARTPEFLQETERKASEILLEERQEPPPGQALSIFMTSGGFEMTIEDRAEMKRPAPATAHFLIGRDGVIRWARVDPLMVPLPSAEELSSLA